ncbi:glycosyltransferase [Candidatus Omnitrophota bacterium]
MSKIIFWSSFFIVFYIYFGYIGFSILLSKLFGKRVKKKDIYPSLSIIVPCYNEENVIRQKLENLCSVDYPKNKLQIMIVSESKDKTNDIVREFKNKGVELYAHEERHGKTVLLYKTVPYARGDILVFSDANAIYEKDALKKLSRNFYEEKIGAVTGVLKIKNPDKSSISKGEYIYKKYETLLRKSTSKLRCLLNADGSIFAIRKKLYSPISPERGDDFELVIRVLLKGYDSVFEPEAISYEDASLTVKAESARKIRMVSWFLKSTMILLKEMFLKFRVGLIFQIISHKLLRWLSPYFLMILFISNLMLWKEGSLYFFFLVLQASLYLMGILGIYISSVKKKKIPFILGAIKYFLMFNYAFMVGVFKGLVFRKDSPEWEKVRA